MNILAFNGSPRLKGNTATMLDHAVAGARDAGAAVETCNLYRMKYSGCVSCFTCKRLDKERPIVCAVKDDLQPVLEKIRTVDAILIATPVYFGGETASTRALIERLCFPYLNYADYAHSHFPRSIPVGLIYTMNVPAEMLESFGYNVTFERTRQTLAREFGDCEMIMACNTTQYDDYARYEANATAEAKKEYRDTHFNDDCLAARKLGGRLVLGKQAS